MSSQFDEGLMNGFGSDAKADKAMLKMLKASANDTSMSDAEFRQAAKKLLNAPLSTGSDVRGSQWEDR